MGKFYRLMIFDWEGTLGDTVGLILDCLGEEAKRLNFGEINRDLARSCVCLGLNKAIQKNFPNLTSDEYLQLIEAVQSAVRARHSEVYLFPGAKSTIEKLYKAGINLAIATNKSYQSLQRALQMTELEKYFTITRSAGQTPPKPDPTMLREITDVLDVPIESSVLIGDSSTDIEMAKSIGMDAIGVNFYHQDASLLTKAGAEKIFDDYQQLSDYLFLHL